MHEVTDEDIARVLLSLTPEWNDIIAELLSHETDEREHAAYTLAGVIIASPAKVPWFK